MFGAPKCGHCDRTGTKIVEISPSGGIYKQVAIACSNCQAILSTSGYYDVGSLVKGQENILKDMDNRMKQMEYMLTDIQQSISRMR